MDGQSNTGGRRWPALALALGLLLAAPASLAAVQAYRCEHGVRFTVRPLAPDAAGLPRVDLRFRGKHYQLTKAPGIAGTLMQNEVLAWHRRHDASRLYWRDGQRLLDHDCEAVR